MDKYAIYLRKSRADLEAEKLGEGETLTRHKNILTELAARKGLYVETIYQEIVSGETIAARPEIQKLINDCYAGKYRGIIIIDVDRLSRGNQGDMQTIMDCLKFSNGRDGLLVVTPTKTYDVAHNPDDEEYMEFVLFMSRREYKTIQKRLDRGKKQAVVEGEYMGANRPYGYDIVKTKTARTLKPNPDEAPIVQKIFDWKVNKKMTPGQIARKLTAMGVPTYTGADEWNVATIKTYLQNPVYCGKSRWNDRMTIKSMVDGKLISRRPRSTRTQHYMEYEGKQPALISEELFREAQKSFYSDKTRSDQELKNPLAGLLVCQKCGYAMLYQAGKLGKPRVLHRQSQICKVKSALLTDVTAAFIHGLKLYLEDYEVKVDNQPDIDENDVLQQISILEKEKKKIEKLIDKIFTDYEEGIYTANEFVKRKAKHNDRIEAIDKEIEELQNTIPEKVEYEEKITYLHNAIDLLTNDEIPAKLINDYLKLFVHKIEFSRDNNDYFILDIYLK